MGNPLTISEKIEKGMCLIQRGAFDIGITARWSERLFGQLSKDDAKDVLNNIDLIIMQAQKLTDEIRKEYNFLKP